MATRAIKKLTKKDELKTLEEINKKVGAAAVEEEDEGSESDSGPAEPAVVNKFNLLNEDDGPSDEPNDQSEPESASLETKPKKKEKKKKNKQKSKEADDKNVFKFVSSLGPEDDESETAAVTNEPSVYSKTKHLLQIESKHLNYDNEMIRMFGARIVQNERANAAAGAAVNQRGMRRAAKPTMFRHNNIVSKRPTWPPFFKAGLSMRSVKEDDPNSLAALAAASNSKPTGVTEYAFEHDTSYQNLQFAFMNAIESMDHNNIMHVLHQYPYHVDSLIQMSEVSRIHDDSQMAADLMERALYAIQNSFHPSFSVTAKSNQANIYNVLNYNRAENRCLFVALFKHILFISSKACYRTSLELSKLLLSLDIEGDPLGVVLLIDLYTLRSSQYAYLVDFYESFDEFKHLSLMPNMALSVALAHYSLYRQNTTSNKEALGKATKMLKDALVKFPYVLMELLEKCGITPDKQVEKSRTFAKTSNLSVPQGLKYLLDLYVLRMHYEWRIPENIQWLESTVKELVSNEKSIESSVNEYKKKFKTLFTKVPVNLYRHLILCDYKEIPVLLPPDYPSTATYVFDPVPPKNTIVSYTRPARTQPAGDLNRADSLLTFFQSLWPNFNLQDNQQPPRGVGAAAAAAVVAAADEDGNNHGRFEVPPMINRIREFLAQMQQHFPAADLLDINAEDFADELDAGQHEEDEEPPNPGNFDPNNID